jgi:hypothetical protein
VHAKGTGVGHRFLGGLNQTRGVHARR